MRILLANDDGINAPGIAAAREAAMEVAEVTLVAPESEMSAVGHAITLTTPLRARTESKNGSFFGYAVNGTPADCVKLAARELMKGNLPDVVLSGVNQGANVATNVIYSGTVSAATEGTILGIPSIAVSLASFTSTDFSVAARIGASIARLVARRKLPKGTLLNVNVPALRAEEIKGIRVCRMGSSTFREKFEKRVDLRGHTYYWQGGEMMTNGTDDDADIVWLKEGYVTITPIQFDLTKYDFLDQLGSWDFTLGGIVNQ